MKENEFPDCCGILVLSGFGHTVFGNEDTNFDKEEIEDFLDQKIRSAKLRKFSMLMVTLNNEQILAIGSVFRKLKFRKTKTAYHPQHRTKISVFIYELSPPKKE